MLGIKNSDRGRILTVWPVPEGSQSISLLRPNGKKKQALQWTNKNEAVAVVHPFRLGGLALLYAAAARSLSRMLVLEA